MKDNLTNLLSRARFLKFLDEQIHHSVEFGARWGCWW